MMLDGSSPTILLDIGIAQGSCLDPFMIIAYLNDIVRCSHDIIFPISADDTTLYVSDV